MCRIFVDRQICLRYVLYFSFFYTLYFFFSFLRNVFMRTYETTPEAKLWVSALLYKFQRILITREILNMTSYILLPHLASPTWMYPNLTFIVTLRLLRLFLRLELFLFLDFALPLFVKFLILGFQFCFTGFTLSTTTTGTISPLAYVAVKLRRCTLRQFYIDFAISRPIVENCVVKLEKTTLHTIITLELEECETFTFFRVIAMCDYTNGFRLNSSKVLLQCSLCGREWEISL